MNNDEEFFNVKLENHYNEPSFKANFPSLYNFFRQKMGTNANIERGNLQFKHLYGFKHPTKGQCYEVCYMEYSAYYGYASSNSAYFIECHVEGDEFILDNIGNPLK